jgi:hypothetical protein
MSERHEITKKRVIYEMAGTDAVEIHRGIEYRRDDSGPLTMDVYYPAQAGSVSRGAVVFIIGFSDIGARRVIGCSANEMESFISWGRLVAASGLVAVTYTTGLDPAADAIAIVEHVHQRASSLRIDVQKVGLWACSGHVPVALSLLMQEARGGLSAAALCYGYMLDAEGSDGVASAAKMFHFVNATAGRSVADLRQDIPMLVVRAGQDQMPGLNEALDGFVTAALKRNLPVAFLNHPTGPHAFDTADDSPESRATIRQTLAFLQARLG